MTNTLVKITAATIVVATNWVSVGTFTDRAGRHYDVLQGQIVTNVVGKMEAEGQTVEHIFRSTMGPTNAHLKLIPIATQTFPASGNAVPPLPTFQVQTNQ